MMRARWIACACVAAVLGAPAFAEDYPAKPIRLVVTTPSGGLVDVLGRILAQALGERMAQSVVVENRAGATTQIGIEAVARAPADGYTLLLGSAEMTMLPVLKKNYALEPLRSFAPIALVATSWTVFAVNPRLPIKTLADLIGYAKAHPNAVRYGTNGVGGALHIAVEMLRLRTGIELVHVPYKGGGQAIHDVISGEIEMASLGLASVIARREQVRVLAQTGPTRHPLLRDVPTTAEADLPDVTMETWFGLMAPADTPDSVIARLARALQPLAAHEPYKERLFAIGCSAAWLSPEAFAAYITAEGKKWARIIPAVGIRPGE